jgi:hypothetical protein
MHELAEHDPRRFAHPRSRYLNGCYKVPDIDIGDGTGPGSADVSALFSSVRSDPSLQRAATSAW